MAANLSVTGGDTTAVSAGVQAPTDGLPESMSTNAHKRDKSPAPTKAQFEKRRRAVPTVTKDTEFQCPTCAARCTRDADGTEYGHMYNCPERPDCLPGGHAGGGSWYDGGDA